MPARKIPKNYRNITGGVPTSKSAGLVKFESSLERDFLYLLEFDPRVERFEEQPVTILYCDPEGAPKKYTPDILAAYRQDLAGVPPRRPTLFEVKYRDDLRKAWRTFEARFRAAMRYAKERDWAFRTITEREIRTPYLRTAHFLLGYRDRTPDQLAQAQFLSALRTRVTATPADLLAALTDDRLEQTRILPTLWWLLAHRRVWFEPSQPLTMAARLSWITTRDGGDHD